MLRERQDECDGLGRLPDSTLRDYIDAGFWRTVQPRRFGGYEFDLDTFLRITMELSRGCPSSGWVFGLTAAHNLIVGSFEELGQIELFGDGDFRCPLSALPARRSASTAATASRAGGTTRPAATSRRTSSAAPS